MQREESVVYFRGQTKRYFYDSQPKKGQDLLVPSLFRDPQKTDNMLKKQEDIRRREDKLKEFINDHRAMLEDVPKFACSALLQQYQMSTPWLDLVDNIWVALWFSAYETKTEKMSFCLKEPKIQGHTVFMQYKPKNTGVEDGYSYVYLMQFSNLVKASEAKEWNGENTPSVGYLHETNVAKPMEIMDLRITVPSLYIRPHNQHGIMVKRKNLYPGSSGRYTSDVCDYGDHLVLVLRIKTKKIFQWFGMSPTLQPQFFFPSPVYDYGYRHFLNELRYPPRRNYSDYLGNIPYVG